MLEPNFFCYHFLKDLDLYCDKSVSEMGEGGKSAKVVNVLPLTKSSSNKVLTKGFSLFVLHDESKRAEIRIKKLVLVLIIKSFVFILGK